MARRARDRGRDPAGKIQYDCDRTVYKQRNVIERVFCRLKDWRRLATRFDRNIKNFIGAVALAAAVICGL